VVATAERQQEGCDKSDVIDRRVVTGIEPTLQPASRYPGVSLRVLDGNQRRQLEQVSE
jgi:hypothetical protein